MPKLERVYRIALVLLLFALLVLVGLFIVTSIPVPDTITDSVGDASVLFETSDSAIFSESACYTVRWEVSGIEGVYLNDKGKIGQGEELLCYEDVSEPELRVVFEDGSDKTYELEIVVIQQQPNFWIVVSIAGILLFFSAYFVILPYIGGALASRKAIIYAVLNLIVLTSLTLAIVFGILEAGLRFYFSNYGTENDRIHYVYSIDEIQKKTARLTGVPYALYVSNPNYQGHNQLGYRGAETTLEKPADTFRIVAIGESTTYGFGVNSNQAYPDVLQDILREDYGYTNVEVINAGVMGYTSFELLANFQFRVLELNPDLIIYYGAKNDADTRFEDPGCYNNPSPMYGLTTFNGLWRTEFDELPSSVLYRYFAINTGIMENPYSLDFALAEVPIAEECKADEDYTEEELVALNQPIFAGRNFRNLLVLAQHHNIEVMVSEFAHPTELSQVDGDENLLMSPARVQAIAEINALYRQISEELGVHYYAFKSDFVIEPDIFWTTVHMKRKGTKEQAKLYAKYLVENDLIPLLSDRVGS